MANYKWATIVPLIGGLSVAGKIATGKDPDFFISYTPFGNNEKNVKNYFNNVPHYLLDTENRGGFDVSANRDVDFVQAVCPCAGLSLLSSGSPEQRETMNKWMYESAEFVTGELKPRVFWGENAPALFTSAGEHVRNKLRAIADKNGYSFSVYCTNTMLHGIPQARKRTFYFFWRDSNVPVFNYYKKEHKPLGEYLQEVQLGMVHHGQAEIDAARDKLNNDPYVQFLQQKHDGKGVDKMRQYVLDKGKRGITVLSYLIQTEQMEDAIEFFEKSGQWPKATREANRIMNKVRNRQGFWDGSFPVYRADGTFMTLISRTLHAIHPLEDRVLTLREGMHMMGLPHDFELVSDDANHICQNVPVTTGADMTREVIRFLDGESQISDSKFMLQNNLSEKITYREPTSLVF